MEGNKSTIGRDKTIEEVLLKAQKRSIRTLDELIERCLPTLTARLWATCCWSPSGWKIGDYNFLILSTAPEKDAEIYIQFWSEPQENVSAEVSSGEWSPGTLKYVGQEQRERLAQFGFAVGGRAKNFSKEIEIASSAQAEAVAREVFQILFEVFGYRGRWALNLRRHEGQRAQIAATYTSLTPEDFAKLATASDFEAVVAANRPAPDERLVLLRRGARQSVALLEGRVPSNNLYTLVTLQTTLPLLATDAAIQRLNATMRFVQGRRSDEGVVIEMPIALVGGVTEQWLAGALERWTSSCRRAEAVLRKGSLHGRRGRPEQPQRVQ